MARDDLEEMSVPAYGMTEVGRLVQPIGEFTAELSVIDSHRRRGAGPGNVRMGKPQKALPAAVKQENAEEVKELLAAKKDIEKMLPAISERLDNLYLQRKSWPLELWRERYLGHPLTAVLAAALHLELLLPLPVADDAGHLAQGANSVDHELGKQSGGAMRSSRPWPLASAGAAAGCGARLAWLS